MLSKSKQKFKWELKEDILRLIIIFFNKGNLKRMSKKKKIISLVVFRLYT